MSSVAIRTVGCRLNQAESAHIASSFRNAGYDVKSFDDSCDVYIVHSCTITKNADRKSVQYARSIKKKHPDSFVVMAGCAVEAAESGGLKDAHIDLFVSQNDKYNIPSLIPNSSVIIHNSSLVSTPSFSTTRALIKIQDGCNFCCSYCIVPQARGKPSSRPKDEIINEIRELADNGYREFVLTGANLGCYTGVEGGLVKLLEDIQQIELVGRIRLSSIEMSTVERDIIDLIADSEKICSYLHLPLQSGDDDILKAMGRRYITSDFANTIEYAASKIDLPGLGTDIITGFPGETEQHHRNTIKLIKSLPLNNLHVFPYSERPGTAAAELQGSVDVATRKSRCEELIEIGNEKRNAFASSYIGKPVSVLVEKIDSDQIAHGWTSEYLEAELSGNEFKSNDIVVAIPSSADAGKLYLA
ncbi:tRNA (N(6)-L-threonylcarbamoyladenosine(37)-C(2))-methylthiotransferase MtaB [bacterium E08(2017)]|nr:tRNA (N(6)-L-threonylcarbamoyladenosine(37)-C(2))-methylthiotransferase MtaB [bacterium E08(2017)]